MRRLFGKLFGAISALSLCLQIGSCCAAAATSVPSQISAIDSRAQAMRNNVRSITLPHFEPALPMAPGRDEYLAVCVSCHSPRYVMMQPFFPQHQWEETVDKMAKVYGAQFDQDQRFAIVQYLVATHGPDSASTPAGDDELDFISFPKPNSRPQTVPLLSFASESSEHERQVNRGAELFERDCTACHGLTGRGDGFVAEVLLRKPKDLATTRYSVRLLSDVLWNGKRGTAMPSWRGLSQQDLSAVAAYVQNLHPSDKTSEVSAASLQRGNAVFLQNCAPCHGVSGDGKGPVAPTLIPDPANFTLKQPDADYVLRVLTEGIPGTAMPSWKNQIPEPDRRALADYIRSLFTAK